MKPGTGTVPGRGKPLKELREAVLELIYPSTAGCPLCGREVYISAPGEICETCRKQLIPVPGPHCPRCGRTVIGGCCHEPYASDGAAHPLLYDGLPRKLVHRLKYKNGTYIPRYMAPLLQETLQNAGWPEIDAVVPVPLHRRRKRERGYNQSELLARALADRCGIPVKADWLQRTRYTPHQVGLTEAQRRQNLKGAFFASPEVRGKVCLLIDDVYTTGSTAEACALALKEAGAESVYIECLCAVVPDRLLPGEKATGTLTAPKAE